MALGSSPDSNLDHVDIQGHWPFAIENAPSDPTHFRDRLEQAEVVLTPKPLSLKTRVILVTECTLRTNVQITMADRVSWFRRLARIIRLFRAEYQMRKAVRGACAVQCNGTPTYESYRSLNPNAMLFFDTRVGRDMLATNDEIASRVQHLVSADPLRLVFSGRITAIKGVLCLPDLAEELVKLRVPFVLDVFGDGDQLNLLRKRIASIGREKQVRLHGAVDFRDELMPYVRQNADLFVCPHPQGDPSCTYLETLSCGVPIVGFDNEALQGLAKICDAVWSTPLGHIPKLAGRIAELNCDRKGLADAFGVARDFGSKHLFEVTFERRVAHIIRHAFRMDGE